MKPDNFLRAGSNAVRDIRLDYLWLIGFTLLLSRPVSERVIRGRRMSRGSL